MAYIKTITESDAEGELAAMYRRYAKPDGTVDNVLKAHALNPDSLSAHLALYTQAVQGASPLTRAEREMIAVVVSRSNGCTYCTTHHARNLRLLLPDDRADVASMLGDGVPTKLTDRELAIVGHARRLTQSPASITHDDIDDLRHHGLNDREILDLTQVAAYFAYVNRIVLGLGVDLEDTGARSAEL